MGVKSKYEKGRLKFHSGAVDNEVVTISSAATTTITNYGVTLVKQATDATFKFAPPVLGAHKTIIVADTTKEMTIVSGGATINTAAVNTIVTTLSTKHRGVGRSFDFYGASTTIWYMAANIAFMSTLNSAVALT